MNARAAGARSRVIYLPEEDPDATSTPKLPMPFDRDVPVVVLPVQTTTQELVQTDDRKH